MVANFIPPAYDLSNLMPGKINFRIGGLITAGCGFVIGGLWVAVITKMGMFPFVNTLGAILAPVFGIMISDYYLIKKQKLVNKDIFSSANNSSYYFSYGWHIKAIYSLLIGFVFSAATIWNAELRFLQSFSWLIGAFMSSLTYYLLASR